MDANGLRFWMLADEDQWTPGTGVRYDSARRSLRLTSRRPRSPLEGTTPANNETEATNRLDLVPMARDTFGTWAYWDGDMGMVMAQGALPSPTPLYMPLDDAELTDMALGHDGVLYLAVGGQIVMQDRRQRWRNVTLALEGFSAWRLAADPDGGVWVLDRDNKQLGRVRGLPMPERPYEPFDPGTFRPNPENPYPPRLELVPGAAWTTPERPVAIVCSPDGQVAVLNWIDSDNDAEVVTLNNSGRWSDATVLTGSRHPYSLAWVDGGMVAILVVDLAAESPVYPLNPGGSSDPIGDYYPLQNHDDGPFAHGLNLPPHYGRRTQIGTETAVQPEPLHGVSLSVFTLNGEAASAAQIDSGSAQTEWHRLYLEADIPPHCGLKIYLAANDSPQPPAPDQVNEWHEHRAGERFATNGNGLPRAAWSPMPSEIPYQGGLTLCERKPHRAGLFTVLIQRPRRRVRRLVGQYLHVRVELLGNGHTTPELWALRAYGSRFSYVENYLPEFYQEDTFGTDANEIVPANGSSTAADFMERFINNFEGILTPLEDRIAAAYLITDPRTTPDEALGWLGSWIGVTAESGYPSQLQRELIRQAPELYRRRGTVRGLQMALELATEGGVSGGEIVVLEDWKLRRTFATILGADLADENDPLLAGLVSSGNSYVGDTLFLGDEEKKEFLALFNVDVPKTPEEEEAIAAFFDELAYRVTVLVYEEVSAQDLGLIRRIVDLETPAHVIPSVIPVKRPLLVGVAAIIGVDTYLSPEDKPEPVQVDHSFVGVRDRLYRPAALDPRLGIGAAGLTAVPQANLDPVEIVPLTSPFSLEGGGSEAPPGQEIIRYVWIYRGQ